MTARQEIDIVLASIQEATLSNEEFLAIGEPATVTTALKYSDCVTVIVARAGEGNSLERLQAYALAVDNYSLDITSGKQASDVATNNILIGAVCED